MHATDERSFFGNIRFQYLLGNSSALVCGRDWKETDCRYDYNKFYYYTGGDSVLELRGTRFIPEPDDLFFIPAGTPHSYGHNPEDPAVQYWCHFDMALSVDQRILHTPETCRSRPDGRQTALLFENLRKAAGASPPVRSLREQSILMQIMALHLSEIDCASILIRENDSFKHCLTLFITNNFHRTITLQELSSVACLQKNYFVEVFRKNFGITPIQYINSIRLREAVRLMQADTEYGKSIENISQSVGFSDYRYFSRVFKKRYGFTPSAYRKLGSPSPTSS